MYKAKSPTTTTTATAAAANGTRHPHHTTPANGHGDKQPNCIAVLFTTDDTLAAVTRCLAALQTYDATLIRIESRPSKAADAGHDILVELSTAQDYTMRIRAALEATAERVRLVGDESLSAEERAINSVPAFPRVAADLDGMNDQVNLLCEELEPDHPGVSDTAYRKRRVEIAQMAKGYQHGQPLPSIVYTETETETWRAVYRRVTSLYPTHACREFCDNFAMLEERCGYGEHRIPQLHDVSQFLKERTGFTMRPTAGLLTSRAFLNALAFKVFNATQYIRHHSSPFYSPEPDLCHELMGHVALFADQDYATFCQEIGLASLGASDEDIDRLSGLFMYTVEYGLCGDRHDPRVYGAGLLGAADELVSCRADPQKWLGFDAADAAVRPFVITGSQSVYYVADSLQDVKHKVRAFLRTIKRPFEVRYLPDSESIEVFNVRTATATATADADTAVPVHVGEDTNPPALVVA